VDKLRNAGFPDNNAKNLFLISEMEISNRLKSSWTLISKKQDRIQPLLPGLEKGTPKPAAVLIPFLKEKGQWHILFTHRNNNLPEHSGQVAFPGGRMDIQDHDLIETALREAKEEIGIEPQDIRVLGQLPSFQTVTNYSVTPIVAVIPWPYPLKVFRLEVERTFTIPLPWLANPENHEVIYKTLSPEKEPTPIIYFREYHGETLWGASARFTLALLEALRLYPSAN